MSKSYYPTDRAGRIDWHDNFAKEFPKVGKDLGFTDAEVTNAVNDSKYAVYIYQTLGREIDSDPGHIANAVLSGQSSGEYVDLPAGSGAPAAVPGFVPTGAAGGFPGPLNSLSPGRARSDCYLG